MKDLKNLPKAARKKAASVISSLGTTPRPFDCKKLKGFDDAYRVRAGKYRIIYTIDDSVLTVHVVKVKKRADAYRK